MLVHVFIDLLWMSLSWHRIRYRTFHPAPFSVSGLQLLSNDGRARRGQLVPAAGAAAYSPDQKGAVEDKCRVRSSIPCRLMYGKESARQKMPLPRTSHGTVWRELIFWANGPSGLRTSYVFQRNLFLLEFIFVGIFCWQTLNCHNSEPVRAFDLISTLRATPKYQLPSGSLVGSHRKPPNWHVGPTFWEDYINI